jgi:predicted dehydrogenase
MADKAVGTNSFATGIPQTHTGKKLRIAMIGCGGIAEVQLDALKKMADVEIVAAVDDRPERLRLMEEKFGLKKVFSDWKSMLTEVQPAAVSICTPNGLHAPASVDSSSAGCHVITEKPMAMTPGECEQMIEAARNAKKHLVVGFQFRYHPATQFITRARDAGQFGRVLFVKCQALRRRGIPNWGVFGQKHLQGGGPMMDIGVHVIEMAHYAMGSPKPVAASGNTWTYLGNKPSDVVSMWPNWDYKTYTVEDLAIGQIRFDNGAIMQIEASFAAHIEKDVWNFTLVGDKGGATWDPPAIFTDRAGTMINSTPAYLPKSDFGDLFVAKLRKFVDTCLYNKPTDAPGEAGLAVQKILDGIYRSAEAGKEVQINSKIE